MVKTFPVYGIFERQDNTTVYPFKILETNYTIDGPRTRTIDGVFKSKEEAESYLAAHSKWLPNISSDQIKNGFSGLSVLTRNMVLDELRAAQRDTSVEYHRSEPDVAQKLWIEIQGLNVLIACCEAVNEEFKEISS